MLLSNDLLDLVGAGPGAGANGEPVQSPRTLQPKEPGLFAPSLSNPLFLVFVSESASIIVLVTVHG